MEVLGQALIGVAIVKKLIEVGGMRQKRRLGLSVIAQGSKAVIDGLVEVTVPGMDDAEVDVRDGSPHGRIGRAVRPGVVRDELTRVLLGRLVVAQPCVTSRRVEDPLGVVEPMPLLVSCELSFRELTSVVHDAGYASVDRVI
jgi:hypothetical protein